jgi:hypothetical protein
MIIKSNSYIIPTNPDEIAFKCRFLLSSENFTLSNILNLLMFKRFLTKGLKFLIYK